MNTHGLPRDVWKGQPCFILGGGPSLGRVNVRALRGRGRVIAVNNAWELAPWADMLYFADRRWWEWNGADVYSFPGMIVTRSTVVARDPGPVHRVCKVKRLMKPHALSTQPHSVAGWCGGSNALNLAWALGCDPIVLLGFDGGDGNWHRYHKHTNEPGHLAKHSRPALYEMAAAIRAADNRTIINSSEGTQLTCFPTQPLRMVLNEESQRV